MPNHGDEDDDDYDDAGDDANLVGVDARGSGNDDDEENGDDDHSYKVVMAMLLGMTMVRK